MEARTRPLLCPFRLVRWDRCHKMDHHKAPWQGSLDTEGGLRSWRLEGGDPGVVGLFLLRSPGRAAWSSPRAQCSLQGKGDGLEGVRHHPPVLRLTRTALGTSRRPHVPALRASSLWAAPHGKTQPWWPHGRASRISHAGSSTRVSPRQNPPGTVVILTAEEKNVSGCQLPPCPGCCL